ncbi:MAG: hypothetical protein QG665_35 [Patescibacteria group bacterium]|nr:hypothetical protein [Patescibacteria group bacterium]
MLEMMVVVAIVLAMTAIVIMYIPQFRDRSALDLVAQEIAITVRSAQVYASGGKIPAGVTESRPSYGVHFSQEQETDKNRKFFLYTNDLDNIGFSSDMEGLLGTFKYNLRGVTVDDICINSTNICEVENIDIIYTRPQLGAKIYTDTRDEGETADSTEIYIKADKTGKQKVIIVRSNGQISVENVEN